MRLTNCELMLLMCNKFASLFQPCMIAEEGYPVQTHNVTTDDGYILQVRFHRYLMGKDGEKTNLCNILFSNCKLLNPKLLRCVHIPVFEEKFPSTEGSSYPDKSKSIQDKVDHVIRTDFPDNEILLY